MNKTDKLKQIAFQGKTSSFAIFNQTNITYFTNFTGASALLIPEEGEGILYVPSVNIEQATHEVKGFKVELIKRGEKLMEKIASQTKTQAAAKIAVDALNIESWRSLAKAVGGEEKLQLANGTICELRKIKSPEEVAFMRQACGIADIGMQVAYETVRPGVSELDVAAEVEYAMRKHGSSGTAFDTIIASGASSAYPHGSCTSRIIQNGDLVVVDLGAIVNHYRSDITRTIIAGKPTEKQQRIYQTVKTAQDQAFKVIKPKAPAKDVDAVARDHVCKEGFGEFFVHNLGHGVGLEIHEAPTLSPDSKDFLEAGNVFTVEPGIYIVGFGGVRIEDTVLVLGSGAEKLTSSLYGLQVST
jgi:Xaa-Pro dipeptidase